MKTFIHAARIITRMKAYSIICVLGLVISLAGTLTLVRYIHQEFTVDSYWEDLDRLCLLSAGAPQDASVKELMSNVNVNEEAHFKDPLNHPAIEFHSLVYLMPDGEVGKDEFHYPVRALSVDSVFFKLMPREARYGVVGKLSPNDILLDEELASRLFGKENPIGKPLTFAGKPVTVAGVMKTLPGKSSLDYDVIVPENFNPTWGGHRMSIVRLHRAEDREVVNRWQPVQNLVMWNNGDIAFKLLPLKDNYFEPKMTIMNLLFKRYALMLGISGVIAIPLSIFFIQRYMEEAVCRTPLSWWILVLALLVVAVVSACVLFGQIYKAATINPAIVMKSE